ncbi:MAG: ABC transporter permease, partial [Pseudomonadota bacterium]
MSVYIVRRLLQSCVVVVAMSLIVFLGVNVIGDPVHMFVSPEADQAEIERVIRDLGLDRPIHEQYGFFVLGALE